jgi:8-oxo-dGTP pyrophosphatase MutT (NUDIX family)
VDVLDLAHIRQRLIGSTPLDADGAPRAAVAAMLRMREEPEILFIKRAEHPSDPWSGHMAFPGGRHEARDPSLEDTARRETVEEIGVDLGKYGQLIARLDDVPTHTTGLIVRPFVWSVEGPIEIARNREVDEVHWVPIAPLMRGERDTIYELEWKGLKHKLPGYAVGERVVWGLTYRMLSILFEKLR